MNFDREKSLNYYLNLNYPYTVVPDDGEFFVQFPDLPGCMTQVKDAADIPAIAEEIKQLWLETMLDLGVVKVNFPDSTTSDRN